MSRLKWRKLRRRWGLRRRGGNIDIDIGDGMMRRTRRDRDGNIDIIDGMKNVDHDHEVLIHDGSGSLIRRDVRIEEEILNGRKEGMEVDGEITGNEMTVLVEIIESEEIEKEKENAVHTTKIDVTGVEIILPKDETDVYLNKICITINIHPFNKPE